MTTHYVVTGASGFLGRAVVRELAGRGLNVTAVSRSESPDLPGAKVCRVSDYRECPPGDILIHLAETRDPAAAEEQGRTHYEQSVDLVRDLADSSRARLVYASSALVYGETNVDPIATDAPVYGSTVYTQTKLACEEIVLHKGGAVARLTSVLGTGFARSSVVGDILAQSSGEGPIAVRDAGVVRDFIWIDDAANGLVALAECGADGIFNIGSGIGYSIGAVAKRLLDLTDQPGRPVESTAPSDRPSAIVLDIEKTRKTTGWMPRTNLDGALSKLLDVA